MLGCVKLRVAHNDLAVEGVHKAASLINLQTNYDELSFTCDSELNRTRANVDQCESHVLRLSRTLASMPNPVTCDTNTKVEVTSFTNIFAILVAVAVWTFVLYALTRRRV